MRGTPFRRFVRFLAKPFPRRFKQRIKAALRPIVLEEGITPSPPPAPALGPGPGPAATAQASPAPHTLLELYYQRLSAVDPQQPDFVVTMEELAGMRELLEKRYPVDVLLGQGDVPDSLAVSVIVPVFRNHADLITLLDALDDTDAPSGGFEVILINDCPAEPLPRRVLERASRFPMTILGNPWNAGFAPANNLAARYARGSNLLFLNSDTVPRTRDWLGRMLTTLDADEDADEAEPRTAVVGAKTLFSGSDRIEHFGMYAVYVAETDSWHNAHYFQGIRDGAFAETLVDQSADMVTGAALMIRREVFEELGGFDETYAIGGFEDSDLCRRVRRAGYGIRVAAGAVLEHRKSVSLDASEHYSERVFRCNLRYYNHLWAKTLYRMDADGTLDAPFVRPHERRRVLYVAHGHPPEQIGGTEVYNKNVAEAVGLLPDFETVVLARGELHGPESEDGTIVFDETASTAVPVYRCLRGQMAFLNAHPRAELHFEMFLRSIRPDVVHFNHTEHLSTNFVGIARRWVPGAIVYTLNEFLPICAKHGLMVMSDGRLCTGAELQKCSKCVDIAPSLIAARWKLYRDNFSGVDLFIAPSEQLKEKYVAWGLPADKIKYLMYGMIPPGSRAEPSAPGPGLSKEAPR